MAVKEGRMTISGAVPLVFFTTKCSHAFHAVCLHMRMSSLHSNNIIDHNLSVSRKITEGENFREFRGFVAIHKFSPQNLGVWHTLACESKQSAKVFSLKSFPLYGMLVLEPIIQQGPLYTTMGLLG